MKTIELEDLKSALDEGRVKGLYDNRGMGSYESLHIRGAHQLSIDDAAEGRKLPDDKDAMLVFY